MDLRDDQDERYNRHLILDEVGLEGQKKIMNSRVIIIGTGGLGSPVALYLAAAGVGTLGLVDGDVVDQSNLQRQVIHSSPDLDRPKVDSAKEKINRLNPDVNVKTHHVSATADNILELIKDYDFVVDGTDNYKAKFLINDACVLAEKPFVHAGVLRFEGQVMTYVPSSACYRCVYGGPPPEGTILTCSQAGVLGPVAGMLGTIQATEVLKYITGSGELLTNKLLSIDARTMSFRTIKLKHNSKCDLCGDEPSINGLSD